MSKEIINQEVHKAFIGIFLLVTWFSAFIFGFFGIIMADISEYQEILLRINTLFVFVVCMFYVYLFVFVQDKK